jgi:membrane-associated phospholipid phosphatase
MERALFALSIYAAGMAIYFAGGLCARGPFLSVATPLDDLVPFVPAAMAGYALVYVLPVAALWVETSDRGVRRMRRALVAAYVLAGPFFLVTPVRDADPPLQPATALERLLEWNRKADETKNAFPSMHVGAATVLTLIGWRRSRRWGLALAAATAVIVVSTLLVKQHFLVDLPAGALVGWIAFRAEYGKGGGALAREAPAPRG